MAHDKLRAPGATHKLLRDNILGSYRARPHEAYVLHPVQRRTLSHERWSITFGDLDDMSTTLAGYVDGGPITLAILLIGLIGLAIIVERGYVIVLRSRINGRPFIERVIQLVRGGKVDEAIKACAGSAAALPDMGLLILRSRSRDESDLHNVAGAAALAVVPKLTRRIQYLPTLALIALLLGVAGTVHGVRDTLLATATPGADHPAQLAAGLAGSLSSIELGLGVAIVLILGRAYLVSQSESITEQIHEFSARLINALIDRPDVRLGHR